MPQSKITLIGMEQFLNPDHSIFEELTLPEGIDKDTFIGATLLRCQEFELLYPSPDFMIEAVKVWGMKNYWTFDRWVKLINKQYDPLYNKDYHEEISDTHQGSSSGQGSSSDSEDHTRTDNLQFTDDETVIHSEKAYNSGNTFEETTKDVSDRDSGQTGTVRTAGTNTGSFSNSSNDSYVNGHTLHGYGNIGITAAQTLFMKEVEVAKFNMYEHIADLFAQEFCIMIY